ncbi:MAG: radical SAM protein [Tannerellaceae bacterium]|nr:radical SAM protein [Tannerellaceae bacterium]
MVKVRVEEQALMLWNRHSGRTAILSGKELETLGRWLAGGKETGFIHRLRELALLPEHDPTGTLHLIQQAGTKKGPLRSLVAPESLHIELTSRCPLQCPQCYKEHGESQLASATLQELIRQADQASVFQIALGGGEPLLYPDLPDVIRAISNRGMAVILTTSGVGLTRQRLDRLMKAGVDHIQVSLNGSTEEVHSKSRQEYNQACQALVLLAETTLSYGINWVARMDNIDDLPALVRLARKYKVSNINILRYKPSPGESYQEIALIPEKQQQLLRTIKEVKDIPLKTDSAYSSLLCFLSNHPGLFTGCGAGRRFMAIDAKGHFRPCSHVPMTEQNNSILDYWYHSSHPDIFRRIEDHITGSCKICQFLPGCRGCRAITSAGNHFYAGEKDCSFFKVNNE